MPPTASSPSSWQSSRYGSPNSRSSAYKRAPCPCFPRALLRAGAVHVDLIDQGALGFLELLGLDPEALGLRLDGLGLGRIFGVFLRGRQIAQDLRHLRKGGPVLVAESHQLVVFQLDGPQRGRFLLDGH